MPVSPCLPSAISLPIPRPSGATPSRAAGLSSQRADTSQTYRFTRHGETLSRIVPQAKPNDREFRDSLRSYPKPVKAPMSSNVRQSTLSNPNPSPIKTSVRSNIQQSVLSNPSPVKAPANAKPFLRPTPAKQLVKRTLYSDMDAKRDLSLLKDSAKLLTMAIQFNRKRLVEGDYKTLNKMENTEESIKSLMQKIEKADPTSPDTSVFRRQTIVLKKQVDESLQDIGNKYVRETPPRPAIKLRPQPRTAIEIDRRARYDARSVQNADYRLRRSQELAASDEPREIHIQWRVNFPIDPALIQEKANTSPVAEEKTNESTLAGVRTTLRELGEFLDDGDPDKMSSADGDKSSPDIDDVSGYASQDSSRDSSPPISPKQTKQTIQEYWGNKETYRKKQPSTRRSLWRPWEDGKASSPIRSLRTPNLDPQCVFRATARDFAIRMPSTVGDTKEV
jgi:hypothetical protein